MTVNLSARKFQSTRPRGARLCGQYLHCIEPLCFNPRARGGRDIVWPANGTMWPRFNPRARGGRDLLWREYFPRPETFQSTRPRGARLCRRGAGCAWRGVSIHAPAGGATFAQRMACAWWLNVSIHAPAGGATS